MNCAGSVALIGDESSGAGMPAMLGTAGHALIERMLKLGESDASAYSGYIVHVVQEGNDPPVIFAPEEAGSLDKTPGWFAFVVGDDLIFGVQMMIDEVARAGEVLVEPELFTERYLDMSWLDPRLGGTADVTLVELFGWVHLLDYKNGRVVVEVTDNEQMKSYAVGLLHEHEDAENVRITLVQPNAPHEEGCIRTVEYTRDELKIFELQMKEAADATSAPNASFRVGKWCGYCPAQLRCKAFENSMEEEALFDFADPPASSADMPASFPVPMDIDELARKAQWIPLFDQWCKNILAAIQAHLIAGTAVPGKKLVRTKPHRKWIMEPKQIETALYNGVTPRIPSELLWEEPTLKSPAQIEKLGKGKQKTKIKELIADLAASPLGQLVVADANDPRPEADLLSEAVNDFDDEWPLAATEEELGI
jgi:hypothetical protein